MQKMKKKYYFLISFLLFYTSISTILAQKPKTVVVNSTDDFIKEISSNKIIKIKTNKILLSELKGLISNSNVNKEAVFDGDKIVIEDVENLSIIGESSEFVKILTSVRYAHVLSFKNCKNITLENLEAGHAPGKGYCVGGVFEFNNTKKVKIKNSVLFGSGTEGLTLTTVENGTFENVIIRSCTYGIMTLNLCNKLTFTNCRFTDNQEFDLINVYDSEKINFNNCQIDFNQTGSGRDFDAYAIFNVPLSGGNEISLNKCTIEDNFSQYFCRSGTTVIVKDCKIENNIFQKGYNSNK